MEETLLLHNDEFGVQDIPNNNRDLVTIQTDCPEAKSLSSHQEELYTAVSHGLQYGSDLNSSSDLIVIISETDTDSAISSDQISTQTTMPGVRLM